MPPWAILADTRMIALGFSAGARLRVGIQVFPKVVVHLHRKMASAPTGSGRFPSN